MIRAACLLFLLLPALPAQVYAPGPQVLTFFSAIDDSDQPYGLYLPPEFDPSRKYPLVISLHGAGSNHRLNLRRVFGKGNRPGENDAEASRYFPPLGETGYIVATPLARGTMGYQGIAEQDVYDVLADVRKRFAVDEDRVYLTGLSMGGGGTLWLGLTRPDIWAAVAPVCAAAPEGASGLAPNALNVAVHLFHGEADPVVPAEGSRRWHKQLLDAGVRVEYVEYPGVRHNSWDNAYKDRAIFQWFDNHRRNRFPERVRFSSRHYKYDSAYWVRLDCLTPGTLASADARFAAGDRLTVTTAGLDGFTLNLAGHPLFSRDKPLTVEVDGVTLRPKSQEIISFAKSGDTWSLSRCVPPQPHKRLGAEGPIPEAVSARHIYVFGTADSPGEEEINRRRQQATVAADWAGPRGRLLVNFRVLSDKEVQEADLRNANLVLFGTKETNRLIARYADKLPLELNAGAADYGLAFIAHVGDRYILVNSGLPWWTGADQARRPGFRFIPTPYRLLQGFGDYILFKGSLADVIAEGLFDRTWKVPSEPAARMISTEAVHVR